MSLPAVDTMLGDQLSYVDEVPRFWFSRRWRLAFLGLIGFLIVTCQRVSMEVAIIAMLNQTTAESSSSSPVPETHLSRGYWATRLGMSASGDSASVARVIPTPAETQMEEESALAYYGEANRTSGQTMEEAKTTIKSRGLEDDLKTPMKVSCSNASELAILNTTFFTLISKGDITWSLTEQSGVLDAFYWGSLLIRIPSGFISQRYGGKRVFGFSILVSSICTAVIPITSRVHYFAVILLRFITGASASATVPAMSYLLGRWSPPDERCLLQSIANTGTGVSGTVISVPIISLLCTFGFDGGWPSAFYISGGLGMLWSIVWMLLANDSPNDDSRISLQEKDYINSAIFIRSTDFLQSSSSSSSNADVVYRWEVALTSLPVLALAVNHFTHEWVVLALTNVVPIYLTDVLHMDFKQNSVGTLVLPGVGFWCVMTMSAGAADRLQAYGVLGVTKIRKLMQTIGAVLTAAMMSSVLLMDCHHHLATLSIVTIALSFCGLQYSGSLVAHLDIEPGCAGVTMGVVSTLGASVYFVLPALIRMVLQSSSQRLELKWNILMLLTASCHIFSALLFLLFGSSKWHRWSVSRLVSEEETTRGSPGSDRAKITIDNDVTFDPPNTTANSCGHFPSNHLHPNHHHHHRRHPLQQQQPTQALNDRSEDVYHEALDIDPDAEPDSESSNRSVTCLQRQTSDDSCSHSCVSAASEISERFHSSANRPSNSLNGTALAVAETDYPGRSYRQMALATAAAQDDLSESIV